MLKIAVIMFPGINTEEETVREINKTGMKGETFRWNDSIEKLKKYDGYVIGGGFSYEDRGRAGVIASLDPVMKVISEEAAKGKPVLGICNGAQILVESGLIPGVDGDKLAMSLARNKRIRDGEVLGTGYYNVDIRMKCMVEKGSCMFTRNISQGEIIKCPIAHGEGRFTTELPDLMQKLQEKNQMVFRYCDHNGVIVENFPINPNGAMYNLAAVCNPAGNVMAIMPHPERDFLASEKIFSSMRDAIMDSKKSPKKRGSHLNVKTQAVWPIPEYKADAKSLQFFVSLIITDNERETHQLTLKELGFINVKLTRKSHIELNYQSKPDLFKLGKKLIQSGILLNTNKETAVAKFSKQTMSFNPKKEMFVPHSELAMEPTVLKMLVREKQDFVGLSKLTAIRNRLKFEEVTGIKIGTIWEFQIPTKSKNVALDSLKKIAATNLFFNPHRQSAYLI